MLTRDPFAIANLLDVLRKVVNNALVTTAIRQVHSLRWGLSYQ